MALQSSGSISLNEIHIEAGGSSGTQAGINDSDIRGLIGKSSGAQMSFSEWYGASAVTYMALGLAGSYNTFTSGDYRYYTWDGPQSLTISLNTIGNADNGRIYFKVWGAGGGGGGGGQYAGSEGGAGGYTEGYWVPTSTGNLIVQPGSGGVGGRDSNSNTVIEGGVAGYMNSGNNTLRGGDGGSGWRSGSSYVGGAGGGGAGSRFRTGWSNSNPAGPTFQLVVGGGGGGGGSDQSASGTTTDGGAGGAAQTNTSGTNADTRSNSLGGLGASTSAGGGSRVGYQSNATAAGEAGIAWHGGNGGSGVSNAFGGSGGGGGGIYGGGGGSTGAGSQGVGGGGGSGGLSGTITTTSNLRQTYGNRTSPRENVTGWTSGIGRGGTASGTKASASSSTTSRAGTGGNGRIVIYFKYQNG